MGNSQRQLTCQTLTLPKSSRPSRFPSCDISSLRLRVRLPIASTLTLLPDRLVHSATQLSFFQPWTLSLPSRTATLHLSPSRTCSFSRSGSACWAHTLLSTHLFYYLFEIILYSLSSSHLGFLLLALTWQIEPASFARLRFFTAPVYRVQCRPINLSILDRRGINLFHNSLYTSV
jgi:hypothetical protein